MQVLRIIWAALMGSVVLFGVLCFVITPQSGQQAELVLLIGIGVSAVAEAVVSFVLPANALKAAFTHFEAETAEEPVPTDESSMFGGEPRTQKVFTHPGKVFKKALVKFQTPFILSIALSEAVGLNGFVLAQIGFEPKFFLPFVVAGFVLIAVRYPTEDRIVALLESHTGVRFPARVRA